MKNSCSMIFIFFCLLAGCATKSVPPASIYTISPEWDSTRAQEETGKKNSTIIKMALVRGTRSLTGTEILYTDARYGRNSYAYSRWSDAPVRLLQILFQVALEESGWFGAVVPPTSASEADLLLESTLYDFSHHIKDDGTSDGVVRVRFYLIDNTAKTVTATKEFMSCVAAAPQNAQGAASALNKAATNVACDLVSWLAELGRL
ncbi:MAG: ABC-type transport auxiliary lipoprotein family protein [Deltaproteobacteria bacterium]|nr:ABC-type transport auxiliary lipoprotein family protein [Deltaproteobacteria bacterium]